MSDDNRNPGILLGRHDGVIVVLDAVPWPTEVQRQLDHVLDALGAPRTTHQAPRPTAQHPDRPTR